MTRTKILRRLAGWVALSLLVCLPATAWAEDPVHFNDPNLQAAVEVVLGKTNPTATDMLGLTYLDAHNKGIVDLTGIEHAGNLAALNLSVNHICDISPLAGLTNLAVLNLCHNPLDAAACAIYIPQILANNPGIDLQHYPCAGQYTLTITCSGSGSVRTVFVSGTTSTTLENEGSFTIDQGARVTITATADAGWRFVGWSGSVCSPERSYEFILASDYTVQANFAQEPRTLTVTCGRGGKVTQPGIGSFTHERGSTVPIKAAADIGYCFVGWSGTAVDKGYVADPTKSRTEVVLNEDAALHADFAESVRQFHESWEMARLGAYTPSKSAFFNADEGPWALGDGVSSAATCGATRNRADVLALSSGQTLLLTSIDSKSTCSDTLWIALDESGLTSSGSALPIDANTMISFYEVGRLDAPGLHGSGKNCQNPPCFDNVSLLLTDNRGNILAYVLQRPADAVANVPNAYLGGVYREVFLDQSGLCYRRNLFRDLRTIPAFNTTGAQVWTIEFRVAEHGSAIIDDITIGPAALEEKVPAYRFSSPVLQSHFFTIGANEKQMLIDMYSDVWTFQGIGYFTVPADDPNAVPAYRLWSPVLESHFYTINADEKDALLNQFAGIWTLEGIAFHVFAEDGRPADAAPVYRLWSASLSAHFYTADEQERDDLLANHSDLWTLEGVAWYAYPPQWDSQQAVEIIRGDQTANPAK